MGSVDIPKDKGLELNITKTIYPDSKRVGTTPTKTPTGFFADPTNRDYGGATALTSPKKFEDNFESSFRDLKDFGRSVSSYQGKVEDWSLVQNEMETKFGIEIPHFEDYIPEVDDKYLISPTDPTGIGFALSGKEFGSKAPYTEKIRYIENLISTELDKLGHEAKKNFKGYDHYFDLRKQKAADTQEQMALNMQYADSGWDKWGGMLSGTAAASFTDPLILASLPLSMMYGWQGGIIYATMRTAAIEAIIAGGAETLIQTQVVPYRQSLGQDYTWSDAAKIIGTVSATSGVFAGTLTAGVKGSAQLYKNAQMALAKTNPEIRNKIIGKEFQKFFGIEKVKRTYTDKNGKTKTVWVEQASRNVDPDLMLNYIKDRINELPPTELVQLFRTFPEAIQLHAPYQSAAKQIDEKIAEDVDNPLSKDIEGTVEHMERTNSSLQSVLRNEEPKIPEQPNSPIVLDEKRPVMNHIKMNPDDIEVDAEVFQFKTGGDSKGVLTTLKGVDKWDHNAAGTVMVWERADGKFFIADGHQRLGLAKRIKAKDPKQDVYLMTVVRREADGWNAADVMVEAMTVNIVAATAKAEDVARVFLRMGETHTANILAGRIKPQQALYQNSLGLYRLGDEAFRYWLKGGIKDNIAAQVGHLIDDPQLAINALKLLERTKPANINEARSIIRSFIDAGIIKTKQTDLFGARIIKESLIVERSKVYSSALRELKKDKTIFKALVENDEAIIKSGRNKLDTDYNVEKAEQYGIIIHKIEKLANRKGQLSDELTAAAKLWKSGSKRKAVESFKRAVYESIERGDHEGITPSGSERSLFASQSESPARQKPKENIITEKLKVHDDPHDTNVAVKEADDQLEELIEETTSKSASGDFKTSRTSIPPGREGVQDDLTLSQTTTVEPPSSVLASATDIPLRSRIEVDSSIGEVSSINKEIILQVTDNVEELFKLAKANIKNIESSINNIGKNFPKSRVITDIKNKKDLNVNIKKRQKSVNGWSAAHEPDIARGRLVVNSEAEIYQAVQLVKKQFKVIKETNKFLNPNGTGYRAYHVQLVTKDGLGFELQIHHKQLLDLYEKQRKLPNSAYQYKKGKITLTKKEEATRAKLVAKEKNQIDKLYSEISIKEKGLPEQRAVDIGLFDATARNQLDLTDEVVMDIKTGADGELVPDTKTLKQVLDDVEEDDKIINFLKDCPGIS